MNRDLVFLSKSFFRDHPTSLYREIEHKIDRPYIILLVKIEDSVWGLPFRSHISHENAFWTNKENRCGIDYSKAVIISDKKYIDRQRVPHLRQSEFEAIRGQEYNIYQGFLAYINRYKKAKRSGHSRYKHLLQYSTLQNYEDIIF